MAMPRIAVGQMTSTGDAEANFEICQSLVRRAADAGASLLSLPECFAFLGERDGDVLAFMEPLEGSWVHRYRQLARTHGLWLSLGGFPERDRDGGRAYNTHLLIDDEGTLRSTYRKLHLFDVDLPDGSALHESRGTRAGAELCVTPSPLGVLGLTICYDLRFAELFVALRRAGAELLLVPAAFTAQTGQAHWEVLLRARAIETQCYVAAAAQAGRHNARRESHGHAMIVDPWGAVVARVTEGTGVAVADIDLALVAKIRERMPVMSHRRTDVYGGGATSAPPSHPAPHGAGFP